MSSTYRAGTISLLIEAGEDGAPAIGASGPAFLSHDGLGELTRCTIADLNALKFFALFDGSRSTWYTAVSTMPQAILARAERNRDIIAGGRLRLIRSSSSSPQTMEALEKTFGMPVIEAYRMTEASHQMASNPLPPRAGYGAGEGLSRGCYPEEAPHKMGDT
jgi:oxalate---CoA ligase